MINTTLNKILSALIIVFMAVSANAQQSGDQINITEPVTEDLYLAGRSINVLSDVTGDLIAAGQRIAIEKQVSSDVIAAAERVTIRGNVGDDVRAAGRSVTISGRVSDDAVIAGETVVLEPGAEVGGRMWAVGRTVEVAGNVNRELRAAGQLITISGSIGGNVTIFAEEIELLPTARIAGKLVYRSDKEVIVADGAEIAGGVERKASEQSDSDDEYAGVFIAGFLVSLIFSLCVVYWLFARLMHGATDIIRKEAFKSLGIGLVVFLVTPVLAILLIVSVLGIPLGLVLLATYPVILFFAFAIGIYLLSRVLLSLIHRANNPTLAWRFLGVVIAVIVFSASQFIPFIGTLLFIFLLLAGLGALAVWMRQQFGNLQSGDPESS